MTEPPAPVESDQWYGSPLPVALGWSGILFGTWLAGVGFLGFLVFAVWVEPTPGRLLALPAVGVLAWLSWKLFLKKTLWAAAAYWSAFRVTAEGLKINVLILDRTVPWPDIVRLSGDRMTGYFLVYRVEDPDGTDDQAGRRQIHIHPTEKTPELLRMILQNAPQLARECVLQEAWPQSVVPRENDVPGEESEI